MKNIILISVISFLLSSCSEESRIVDDRATSFIDAFATTTEYDDQSEQLEFWNKKLNDSPSNSVFLQKKASILSATFRKNNTIEDLTESTDILRNLNGRFPNDVSIHHGLVRNYITSHSFKDAMDHVHAALEIGEKKYTSRLMLVDILLENGSLPVARGILEDLGTANRFDEQIRWVKLLDAEGDLDAAVDVMERALENAREANNQGLMVWSLSNLGDMYGHQGNVKKSYESYLSALELSPSDGHSLKGIGWIAFSNDRDYDKAQTIWENLKLRTHDPELDLLLADLFEMKGDMAKSIDYTDEFIARVGSKAYGNMYGSYLIGVMDRSNAQLSLELALSDLEQRSHPMTYCHYAEALHQAGKTTEAILVLKKNVLGQTQEPDAFYIAGSIIHDANELNLAEELLQEAMTASYELGPNATKDIAQRLERI